MAAHALADFLPDFGTTSLAPSAPLGQPAAIRNVEPPPDISAIVAAEVAIAEARLRGEMMEAAEATLAAERANHAVEMSRLEASLGGEAAARIAAAVAEARERITALTSAAAARLLASMLSDDLASRSVAQLAETIRTAMADRDAVRIKIVGPQSLFETMSTQLGPLAAQCDFAEAPGFDLTVAIDGTLYETRLGEWSATVGGAIY